MCGKLVNQTCLLKQYPKLPKILFYISPILYAKSQHKPFILSNSSLKMIGVHVLWVVLTSKERGLLVFRKDSVIDITDPMTTIIVA